jgi:hypoxanthine phosphoribosyltransferase
MKNDPNIEVLISEDELRARISEMGAQITAAYEGRDLVCIGVLKGCVPFIADLIRAIDLPLSIDFLGLSSYGSQTKSTGIVRLTSDLSRPVEGKDLLVVEDIVDTGLTMEYLLQNLETRKPRSVGICTLLHKPSRTEVDLDLDYVGFTVPDRFVIGYGLDYAERFRNLPYIGVLHGDG